MSRIESIKYNLIGKEINEITKTNGSDFFIYVNEYKMDLIVNYGANYEIQHVYIKNLVQMKIINIIIIYMNQKFLLFILIKMIH